MRHSRQRIAVIFILAGVCMSVAGQSKEPACTEHDPPGRGCGDSTIELIPITVTATRRESPVQRVPVSVTAFSGDSLRASGAQVFEDYARSVPGLSFTDTGLGGQKYVIRGVSTSVFAESRAATSVYLDETPITDGGFGGLTYSPDPVLVDIDRIEVLRGPQGTLFGSGSMGGAIRVITNQPNLLAHQGFVETSLSTVAHGSPGYELQAMLNAPLSEGRAAIRAVAYYRDLGGWIDNTVLGNKDVNNNKTIGLRLSGKWLESPRLTVNAKFAYQDQQSNGNGFDEGQPPWTQLRLVPEPNADKWSLLNFDINYRFDWGQLISATSWIDRSTKHNTDATAAYLGPTAFTTVTADTQGEQRDFIQEFRLQSDAGEHLDWLLGLFYEDQHYRLSHELLVPGFDEQTGGLAALAGAPDRLLVALTDRPTDQIAAFGDIIWRFGEHWESTLGGRWFRFDYSSDSSVLGLLSGSGSFHQTKASETGFTPMVSMSYQPGNEQMLYGTIAGGYRPGGTNETVFEEFPGCRAELDWAGLTGIPQSYQSDSLWSYELGIKSGWASRQVYLNAAVFYIEWSDMQTSAVLPCGANWLQNVGEAISKGAEFELVAYPGRDLKLTLNGVWNDARLDGDVLLMGGRKGDRVPGVPEYAFGGSLSWFFDAFGDAEGTVRVDYQYVGNSPATYSYWDLPNEMPSYFLVNLRLGMSKGRWDTALFLDNLFDERGIVTAHDGAAGRYVTTARPFTVGIRARFTY